MESATKMFAESLISGAGLGLRAQHVPQILAARPAISWFEILADNYFAPGGAPRAALQKIRQHYPFTLHSTGLSLGGTDPLNPRYLAQLRELKLQFEPAWMSEHLCWSSIHGRHFHDLLPLPYTRETAQHVTDRIMQAQDFFAERILIENVSSYLSYRESEMSEAEFIAEVADAADCWILLDVNNIYVSSKNHGFDPVSYLEAIPRNRVKEVHLAGFEERHGLVIDTHSTVVRDPVWALFRAALKRFGPVPTMVEWDNDIPEFHSLEAEALVVQRYLHLAEEAAESIESSR